MTITDPDYGTPVSGLTGIALAKSALISEAPINFLYCIGQGNPGSIIKVNYDTFRIDRTTTLATGDHIGPSVGKAYQSQLCQNVLYIPCGTATPPSTPRVVFFNPVTMTRINKLDLQHPANATGFSFMDINEDLDISDLYVESGNGLEKMNMSTFLWTGDLQWGGTYSNPESVYIDSVNRRCLIGTSSNYLLDMNLTAFIISANYSGLGGYGFVTNLLADTAYFTASASTNLKSVSIAGTPALLQNQAILAANAAAWSISNKYGRYGYFPCNFGAESFYIYKVDLATAKVVQIKNYFSGTNVWSYLTQINGLLYASGTAGLMEISPDDLSLLRYNPSVAVSSGIIGGA